MADFVAVLKKTLEGLGPTTPEMRGRVYDKARGTIENKLAALNPPPPPGVAERQRRALEEAIQTVERDYAAPPPPPKGSDPLDELENVFSSINASRVAGHAAAARPPAPAPQPAPAAPLGRATPVAPRAAPATPQPAASPLVVPLAAAPVPPPPPRAAEPVRVQEEPPQEDLAARRHEDDEDDVIPSEDPADEDWPDEEPDYLEERPAPRRRSWAGPIAALLLLAALGGGGYAAWTNRDAIAPTLAGLGLGDPAPTSDAATAEPAAVEAAAEPAPVEPPPAEPAPEAPVEQAALPPEPAPEPPAAAPVQKFTQRLTPDGREVDAGPAGGDPGVGEGTSVASASPPAPGALVGEGGGAAAAGQEPAAAAPADPSAPQPPPPAETAALPVAQRAIFYEERTNVAQGSAEQGSIVWSTVNESPGGDLPPEPAIRAEAVIPGKDLQLRMTIRRNADRTLPASHIVELIFLTPEGFEGGGIENVLRVSMKGSEQETGSPLIGLPAKIADGYFLVALDEGKGETEANLNLLRGRDWIDVPIVYKSGRRALITMEKGLPGGQAFEEAMKAWGTTAG
ncbi:MAG TPA: hypothetical protein VGN97_20180 [Mesorhizobium sp.]|jgi:hypothetical protein|nr:hypothetical protein [Mesorhizobium sp.]